MNVRNIKALAPFKGYVVTGIRFEEIGAQINLDFDKRSGPRCPHCQGKLPRNKIGRRAVMDCPMPHGSIVYLVFPTVQGLCQSCNRYVTTCPKEVHPDCHATWRLMRLVSSWAALATNSEVAAMFEISDGTVRRYDKIVLKEDTPPPCLDGLTKLLIDEKSVRKGHCYVTIILNGETGELLHMQEGRKKECVESFFGQLTEGQRAGIKAVGIDRSGAYQAAVEAWLPNAEIVYDRFHLVMNVNQAVDEVRRSQCRRASKEDRQLLKGQRYLILGNQENLDSDGREKLDRLLEANEAISTAYILKEQFRALFSYQRKGWAMRALANWCALALASGLAPFQRLARSFTQHGERVCGFVKHGLTSALIEGFNNLISRMVHKACGFRDLDYLELKLRHHSVMR
ncbi:MAG: ISL3 family transposase [Verrucomicrobiota bacterium JB025]|nr:ISL3 family transposase [Verrucomicrobiota bacterium JB025]